jgi:CheY-like chemotaxis protein
MVWPSRKTGKNLNILVLDDNQQWRYILKFILELELGVTPTLASTGRNALEVLEALPIDVVISDLTMPEMDGFELLKRVHARFPNTKVIIISGDFADNLPAPNQLMEHGAFAVIPKIEISSKLVNVLRTI